MALLVEFANRLAVLRTGGVLGEARSPALGALTAVLVVLASAEYDLAAPAASASTSPPEPRPPSTSTRYGPQGPPRRPGGRRRAGRRQLRKPPGDGPGAARSGPLIVAVSAIAPLVLWRVHRLGEALPARTDVLPEPPAEPIYVAPEPAEPDPGPAVPRPDREELATVPALPPLGAWMPVAELIGTKAGTSETRG